MISKKESLAKPRCEACAKKVGLMGLYCKCGKLFCVSHLQAEQHSCTYDFQIEGKKELAKAQLVGPLSDKMADRI